MTRVALILVLCVACSSEAPSPGHAPADAADVAWPDVAAPAPDVRYEPDSFDRGDFAAPAPCEAVRVRRVAAWPGGVQLALSGASGEAPVALEDPTGALRPVALAAAPAGPGITGLFVVPAQDPQVGAARLAAATAALDALPAGERVAVWAGGLACELTTDHAHARARLAEPGDGAASVVAARAALAKISPHGPLHRALIVVGDAPPADVPVSPVATVAIADGDDPAAAVAGLLAARASTVLAAACLAAPDGAPLAVWAAGERCPLPAPAPVTDVLVPCDPVAAAADAWPYGDTVTIDLTAAEKATWDARWAAKSREPFTAHVRIGPGEPLPAKIHFRGSTSINCHRKSLAVNLDGGDARRILPGAAGDKLTLLSLCMDDGYVQTAWVDRVLARLGLYPLGVRYVRLVVDGENHGVYLLSPNPKDWAERSQLALAMLLRRGNEQGGKPAEVELPDPDEDPEGAAAALAAYDAVRAAAQGPDADAQLRARFALDGYLRWVAWNTLVRNGDYVDEIYLLGAPERGAPYFQFVPWDPDDVFADCHGDGAHAIAHPDGLLYCAEADLDHAIVSDPAVGARYAAALRQVLAQATDALLAEVMAEVRAELWQVLADDATAAAMVELHAEEPGAAQVATARALIQAKMDAMLAEAAARRADLQAKLDESPR